MPLIRSRSKPNLRGTKEDIGPEESISFLPHKNLRDKSTHVSKVGSMPKIDSANSTLPENLLVEEDHGLLVLSELPTLENTWLVSNAEQTDLAVLIYRHYRAFQSPASLLNPEWTWKKATIEVVALRKAAPAIKEVEDTLLAMTAWFHFLCNIDDEIERMESLGRALVLERIIEALKATDLDKVNLTEHITPARGAVDIFKRLNIGLHHKVPLTTLERTADSTHSAVCSNITRQGRTIVNNITESGHERVFALAFNFIRQCKMVLSSQTISKVFAEVINCLEALKKEPDSQESMEMLSIEDYMQLRMRTIGLSPFFVILETTLVDIENEKIKALELGSNNDTKDLRGHRSTTGHSNDSSSFWTSLLHKKLCESIQRIAGLQNDIVGLSRDMENGEYLNLAVLLLKQRNQATKNQQAINKARATAVLMHNKEMQNLIINWADIQAAYHSTAVHIYAQSLVAFTRTHFTWATHAHRYRSKYTTISGIFSNAAKSTAIEGLRLKARVIQARHSLQKLITNQAT
ncbi:hypothetical protein yc1106_07768 [Curvularia clavata]|uniref:Uncharacterized protein n=1 Tax=Curvularia clavata TaxID=95742 RepID=A0A9Q8ZFH6_CURCL|nr:hypothetical protein yc1106_07768 [Curvularia clavata]